MHQRVHDELFEADKGDARLAKKADEKIEQTVKSYIEQLETIGIHVQQAILFGSYANGTHDEWSDIDLAIVSEDFEGNRFEDRNKIRKITLRVNSDISPMPFRPEDFNDSDYFVKEILETGIRII
ncbi:MAG: nucleotidyltransferase domain-containing protein [Deltaproteobacteria bacterium]|nr:nucleotidyltransferase domain-containing protein [Deltaproteobacteria bacterium]